MSTTPYPFGQMVRIPANITDPTGIPVDPATLTLTIKLPDGSTASYTTGQLTHPATGQFLLDYLPPQAGHYAYRYQATLPTVSHEDEFDVLPSMVDSDAGQIFGWPGAYLTLPEFKSMPTGVNVDDLIANGSAAANDAELANVLLRASRWCDNFCTIKLGAHSVVSEHQSVRVDRYGTVRISPRQVSGGVPLVSMSRIAYGWPGQMQTVASPIPQWVEDGAFLAQLVTGPSGWAGPMIQFGPTAAGRLHVEYDYVAGFPISTLAAAATAGVTSLALRDVTGIQPGQDLAVHDPGVEEPVTVASTWTPATGPATIPLAAATLYAHGAGAGISGMPEDIKEAVGQITIGYIRRSTDTPGRSPAMDKTTGPDMLAYEEAAQAILERYVRDGVD